MLLPLPRVRGGEVGGILSEQVFHIATVYDDRIKYNVHLPASQHLSSAFVRMPFSANTSVCHGSHISQNLLLFDSRFSSSPVWRNKI